MSKSATSTYLCLVSIAILLSLLAGWITIALFLPHLSHSQIQTLNHWPDNPKEFKLQLDILQQFRVQNQVYFAFVLTVAFLTCQVLALPGCFFMAIAGGHFYGMLMGLAFIVLLSIIGSIKCYLFMRSFRQCLPKKLQDSTAWLRNKLQKSDTNPCWVILSGRLFPLIPPSIFNTICSLAQAPFIPYTIAISIASVPQSAVSVQMGSTLADIQKFGMSWTSFGMLMILCAVSIVPMFFKKKGNNEEIIDIAQTENIQSDVREDWEGEQQNVNEGVQTMEQSIEGPCFSLEEGECIQEIQN